MVQYLQWQTDKNKKCMIYRVVSFSMKLNNPYFKDTIIRRWLSRRRYTRLLQTNNGKGYVVFWIVPGYFSNFVWKYV